MALFCVAILSVVLASTLLTAQNEYHVVTQAASWQEAIHGAEGGVDLAMAALNTGDWNDWLTASGSPPPTVPSTPGTAAAGPPHAGDFNYRLVSLDHAGEGNQSVAMYVTIDPPATLSAAPSGQWMRIRAMGSTSLPGRPEVSLVKEDTFLRRMSFFTDRLTGNALATPQATRFVEAIAGRNGTNHAIVLQRRALMAGQSVIDSFDSGDATKSTLSLYDPFKRQSNGDVAMADSTSSDLGGCDLYGSVYFTGPAPVNIQNVHGTLNPSYATTFKPVLAPNPTTWVSTDPGLTAIIGTYVLMSGTSANPARYKLDQLTIGTGQLLTIVPPLAGGDGYVEIWITGDLHTTGAGIVLQLPGVHSIYYVEGDIKIAGGSLVNKSNVAASLKINGVDPAAGITRVVQVTGNGDFTGVINAPQFDFNITGNGEYYGALIGRTLDISMGANFHYDEALSRDASTYSVASWYESVR